MQANNSQIATPQKMQMELVQAPDGSGAYIDVDLPGYMARATIGHLGTEQSYCDAEVLDTDTGERVHYQHQECAGSTELNAALTKFFDTLHALPSPFANLPAFALLLAE